MTHSHYIGDGVTATFTSYDVKLSTPRGPCGMTHEVFLDFYVLQELVRLSQAHGLLPAQNSNREVEKVSRKEQHTQGPYYVTTDILDERKLIIKSRTEYVATVDQAELVDGHVKATQANRANAQLLADSWEMLDILAHMWLDCEIPGVAPERSERIHTLLKQHGRLP